MDQIIQHIKDCQHILIASHAEPDGDSVGSLVALGLALAKLDKKITMFNPSPIPAVYRFLPGADRIVRQIENANSYELAIILDCGDIVRIGDAFAEVGKIPIIINIDHHISNTGFGHFQFIDTTACATAEIIYHLIDVWKTRLA